MTRRDWLTALAGVSPGLLYTGRDGYLRTAQAAAPPVPVLAPASAPALALSSDDPTAWSIAELAAALAARRVTPAEITDAYLRRIDQQNGALGAYVTVARDRATDEARRLQRASDGTWTRGPLTGVPVAHKDLFRTRGVRTTGGSRLYEHDVPSADAAVVARFTSAGAVMLGKTNTHELGGGVTTINPFFGTTHNPRDMSRIAGGSSGGSAAAVAARLALVATGSDTGGSVRIPAAFCGCVGVKPTFGLLPSAGLLGACPTFDHVGLLTRSADDALDVLAAIVDATPPPRSTAPAAAAGAAPESTTAPSATTAPPHPPSSAALRAAYRAARTRGVTGVRIGVPRAYFFDALEPDVARLVEQALARLRADGALVRDVFVPMPPALYDSMFAPIAVSEIRSTYARDWRARPEAFSPDFAAVFAGPGPAPAAVAAARRARAEFERAVARVFVDVEVLAMPTVPVVAPRLDGPIDGMRILRNTWPFNAARVPAVSVPCGDGAGGLPVGLQLVGRMFDDASLLAVAAAVRQM